MSSLSDDLSFKAIATQSLTYNGPYYNAINAVDRNTDTCMRTDDIGNKAPQTQKTTWWKVDLGGMYRIYSISILFKNYNNLGMYHIYYKDTKPYYYYPR